MLAAMNLIYVGDPSESLSTTRLIANKSGGSANLWKILKEL
jgi:hypothetical protein